MPHPNRPSGVAARYTGLWHLPDTGRVPNPHAVLIQPDGHVAWVDIDGNATGLLPALALWTGFHPKHVVRSVDVLASGLNRFRRRGFR